MVKTTSGHRGLGYSLDVIFAVGFCLALSLKIRIFGTLPMEKPGFFVNADILNESPQAKFV